MANGSRLCRHCSTRARSCDVCTTSACSTSVWTSDTNDTRSTCGAAYVYMANHVETRMPQAYLVRLKRRRSPLTAGPGALPLRWHATTSIKSSIAHNAVARGIVPMHFSYAYLVLMVRILVVLCSGVSTAHTYSGDRCIPACSQTASDQRSSTQGAWHWHACRQSTWP